MKTPFEKMCEDIKTGKINAPHVYVGDKEVDPILYDLSVHAYYLKLMSIGLKTKNVKLWILRKHYGFKSRTAKECLNELNEIRKNYTNQN